MRSRDYKNPYDSYGEFSKAEMVRVALVEGMKPKYPFQERLRYKELVEDVENSMIIYPTDELVRFTDKICYNLDYKGKFIGHLKANRLVFESFKQLPFEGLFTRQTL